MSAELQEFALKVASALETYAETGPQSLEGTVPFHRAMLKMSEDLRYRHRRQEKRASLLGTIGWLAPGWLTAGGLATAAKHYAPAVRQRALNMFQPQELVQEGVGAMLGQAKGDPTATLEALRSALGKDIYKQLGQAAGPADVIKPWQIGLAGLGGLAAGHMMADDNKSPMIFK